MCRLFGLTAGTNRVKATFWLLDAPDSLEVQSRRNVDGTGLGYFGPDGAIVLDKQPEPAFRDREFRRAAQQAESSAFVAHVRWATAGGRTMAQSTPSEAGRCRSSSRASESRASRSSVISQGSEGRGP